MKIEEAIELKIGEFVTCIDGCLLQTNDMDIDFLTGTPYQVKDIKYQSTISGRIVNVGIVMNKQMRYFNSKFLRVANDDYNNCDIYGSFYVPYSPWLYKKYKSSNYEKGEKVLVSHHNLHLLTHERIYIATLDDSVINRYVVVMEGDEDKYYAHEHYSTESFKCIGKLPKYKAYTNPKFEWLKNVTPVINIKTGIRYFLKSVQYQDDEWVFRLINDKGYVKYASLNKLFIEYTWKDGSIVGILDEK